MSRSSKLNDPADFLTFKTGELLTANPLDPGTDLKASSDADDRTFVDAIFKGLSIGLVLSSCAISPTFLGIGLLGKAALALGGAALSKVGEKKKHREVRAKRQIDRFTAIREAERLKTIEAIAYSQNEEIRAALPYAKPGTQTHDDRIEAIAEALESLADLVKESRQTPALLSPAPAIGTGEGRQTALEALLGSPFISRAFFGGQRSGKSYLMAVASQQIRARYDTKIYHLNLLSYGDEDSLYWSHCADSERCDLAKITDPQIAQRHIDRAVEIVEEFFRQTNAVLIVDEFAFIGSKSTLFSEALKPLLASLANKIIALASAGAKRRLSIWTAAPEFTASSVDDCAKAIKKIPVVFVGITPGKAFDWQGQKFRFDKGLFETLKQNWKELSSVSSPDLDPIDDDRIVYLGGEWLPMGQLPPLEPKPQIEREIENDKIISLSLKTRIEALRLTGFREKEDKYPCFMDLLIDYLEGKDWMTPYAIRQGSRKIKELTGGTEEVRQFLERGIQDGFVISDGAGQYRLG
jgi:hypothetical protein